MLTDDKDRRREKFRPWGKCIPKMKISTARKVVSQNPKKTHNSGSSSDSEMWFQVGESFGYVPKHFPDSAPTISDKEYKPPNDTQAVMAINNLNLLDKVRNQEDVALPEHPQNFVGPYCQTCALKWHRCLCIEKSDWDEMVENLPMPQKSSPKLGHPLENIKLIASDWDEDLESVDYRARPPND